MLIALLFHVSLLHVSLALPPTISPAVARAAVAEAADIWLPYGVAIVRAAPCNWASDESTVLHVVTAGSGGPLPTIGGAWRRALGAIVFAPDGTPATVVTVYIDDLLRLIAGAQVLGVTESRWPQALRDKVLGRALGRVLAHEVGHFVLHTPRHSAGGLMRIEQMVQDLVAPTHQLFTLSPDQAARLAAQQAATAAAGAVSEDTP